MDHAARMLARGFPPRRWTDPPGQRWRELRDPRDELVVVLSGRLRIWLEDAAHDLGPGDELLIPAQVEHGSEVLGDEPVELLFGYFQPTMQESAMSPATQPLMTARQRVFAALAGQRVDRLPVTLNYQQLVIEDRFCALTGRPEHERIRWLNGDPAEHARILRGIVEDLGCDVALARHWAPTRAERADRAVVQRDGRWWLHQRGEDRWDEISEHPGHARDYAANETCHVQSCADLDARIPLVSAEERLASGGLDYARATVAACGDSHYVITGGLEGVVYRSSDHFGLTNLFYAMKDTPELVDHCCRRIHANHLETIRALAACGGDAIYIDDATATSDMISKRDYERFSLPYLREQVAVAKSLGMQVWLIYFGAIADRIDLIADTGADLLMCECSMKGFVNDIGDYARRVGGRIALASNIDPVQMIQNADDATLDAEIRRQVEALRPAKGAILAPASPVTPSTSPARLRWFLDRCRIHGAR